MAEDATQEMEETDYQNCKVERPENTTEKKNNILKGMTRIQIKISGSPKCDGTQMAKCEKMVSSSDTPETVAVQWLSVLS